MSKNTNDSLETTQPSSKYGDLFFFVTNFQCLDSVPSLPLPPSAVVKMSSWYLEWALMRRACVTSCFRMHDLSMTAENTESLISPLATNPMPDPCSNWKTFQPRSSLLQRFRRKNKITLAAKFRSFAFSMDAAIFEKTNKKCLTAAVKSLSFGPSTSFSIRWWNSSTGARMWLSKDHTRLSFKATSNGFCVAE